MAEWTKKRARQHSVRRIDKCIESLGQVAYNWGDLDQLIVDQVDAVVDTLNELKNDMNESCEPEEVMPMQ